MELRARDHNAPTAWLGPSLQQAADAHCRDAGKQMTFVERPFCSSFVQGRPGLTLPTPGVSRRPHPHLSAGARNGHSTRSCCHIPSLLPLRPLSLQWRDSRDPARRRARVTARVGTDLGDKPLNASAWPVQWCWLWPGPLSPSPGLTPPPHPSCLGPWQVLPVRAQACPSPQHLLPRPPAASIARLPKT